MAEPQRQRGARKPPEVVHVFNPAAITTARGHAGMSQARLGELCHGRSAQAVSLVESGQLKRIVPDFAHDLARNLGLTWSDVFSLTSNPTPSEQSGGSAA